MLKIKLTSFLPKFKVEEKKELWEEKKLKFIFYGVLEKYIY